MENDQEGIELETVDLEQEGIVLPNVDEEVGEETETGTNEDTETQTNNESTKQVDEEKESLKRALNAERKARKNAEKENKDFEARLKALEEASKAPTKTTEQELIDNGVDESIAKSIAAAIDKKQSNSDLAKELAEVKFENSLNTKSKEEGFEDIIDYADEIKELVNKGLTIEQSYYAVTYDKPKTKNTPSEIERKVEATLQNNQARKNILGNVNNNVNASANSKPKINLSSEEKAIATMSGMTPEEYAAVRDMESVNDYQKYNAKKKK